MNIKCGMMLIAAVLFCGCKTLRDYIPSTPTIPSVPTAPTIPSLPPVKPQQPETPAVSTCTNFVYCPQFLEHGIANENGYRADAIAAAKAQGCGVEILAVMCNYEVLALTMRFHSNVDGHTVDSDDCWWWYAMKRGVKMWCLRIAGQHTEATANEWCYRTAHEDYRGTLTYRLVQQPANIVSIFKKFAEAHGIAVIEK